MIINDLVIETINEGVLTIQFNHSHYNNPFSQELELAVTQSLLNAEKNEEVKAVILTGGPQRSFSVGGDFNEVKNFKGGEEVVQWIDGVVNLYTTSLKMSKPTIAAVDNHVIGIGFQLALTCDFIIGTDSCKFSMPEIKNGIACTLGQYMLEKNLGRSTMTEIVYGCEILSIEECIKYGLINKVVKKSELWNESYLLAKKLSNYPTSALKRTKQAINKSYISELEIAGEISKSAHKNTFSDGAAQKFMHTIVGGK